jgi:hypothetical protein
MKLLVYRGFQIRAVQLEPQKLSTPGGTLGGTLGLFGFFLSLAVFMRAVYCFCIYILEPALIGIVILFMTVSDMHRMFYISWCMWDG